MALSRAQAFATTSDVFALGQPFVSPAPLMRSGMHLGFYLESSESFFIDPVLLWERTNSLIFRVNGEKKAGKSTLLKDFLIKFAALQAGFGTNEDEILAPKIRINDRKPNQESESNTAMRGEFAAATDFLLGDTVSLADYGRINPFAMLPSTNRVELTSAIEDIAMSVTRRSLRGFETLALEVAVDRALREKQRVMDPGHLAWLLATPTLGHVNDYFSRYKPQGETAEAKLAITSDPRIFSKFCEDSVKMSGIGTALVDGTYGKVFGGTADLSDVLSGDIVNLDWTDVEGPPADLLETLINRRDAMLLRLDPTQTPDLVISDEEGTRVKDLPHARSVAEISREARKYKTTRWEASQFSTDHDNLGDAGSEIRELGHEIDKGVGVRIYGRQPATDDILHSITRYGVPDRDAWLTTQLGQGCWGVKLPDEPMRFFQHVISDGLKSIVETNRATKRAGQRRRVSDMPSVKARQRQYLQLLEEADHREPITTQA